MRATIVADDNVVLVDGVACTVDCSALVAEGQHAVQWNETFGEIEFKTVINPETLHPARKPNETITDFAPYQSYLDAWTVEKERQDALALQRQQDLEEAMAAGQQQMKADRDKLKEEIISEVLARLKAEGK